MIQGMQTGRWMFGWWWLWGGGGSLGKPQQYLLPRPAGFSVHSQQSSSLGNRLSDFANYGGAAAGTFSLGNRKCSLKTSRSRGALRVLGTAASEVQYVLLPCHAISPNTHNHYRGTGIFGREQRRVPDRNRGHCDHMAALSCACFLLNVFVHTIRRDCASVNA